MKSLNSITCLPRKKPIVWMPLRRSMLSSLKFKTWKARLLVFESGLKDGVEIDRHYPKKSQAPKMPSNDYQTKGKSFAEKMISLSRSLKTLVMKRTERNGSFPTLWMVLQQKDW